MFEAEGGTQDDPETKDRRYADQPHIRAGDQLVYEAITIESIDIWRLSGIVVEAMPYNAGPLEKSVKDEAHHDGNNRSRARQLQGLENPKK